MIAVIEKGALSGTVKAPPSKSMAHRLIISAALSEGESRISNVALSEDIKATIGCMEVLGKTAIYDDGVLTVKDAEIPSGDKKLFVNESGSTLRFFIPLCLTGDEVTLYGSERLFERPLAVYEEIFERQGIFFEKGKNYLKLKGKLEGGSYEIRGDISSQFITGLLFALPKLSGDSEIKITGKFESKSYILMTLSALKAFGIDIYFDGDRVFRIKGGQCYKRCNAEVEGDWSNAAFFEALNYLESNVFVTGVDENSLQGDKICKKYFEDIKNGKKELSLADCPDLAPILFTVAAYLGGAEFKDTARLKIKESDRAEVMKEELSKFGAEILVFENSVTVKKSDLHSPTVTLSSHNDHRIAMSLAVLSTVYGGIIEDAGAVKKSMPDFYEKLAALGAKVELK
ncbi:MAG: 3-phosphoshikimate 1-carboxyvinyltransferase [Clostridia bacterium]|nr:3-phosphoshikimate 1-carboxyvinyltransferase [Clostridia bacterium]